mmetsp:Transcript_14194/g.41318  ORF Transcript_14194/g.41318 Transcript_14194/m.41318 type:complete len:209 (+) Transcript_14194:1181-1807(+)
MLRLPRSSRRCEPLPSAASNCKALSADLALSGRAMSSCTRSSIVATSAKAVRSAPLPATGVSPAAMCSASVRSFSATSCSVWRASAVKPVAEDSPLIGRTTSDAATWVCVPHVNMQRRIFILSGSGSQGGKPWVQLSRLNSRKCVACDSLQQPRRTAPSLFGIFPGQAVGRQARIDPAAGLLQCSTDHRSRTRPSMEHACVSTSLGRG